MQLPRRTQGPEPDHAVCADLVGLPNTGQLFARTQLIPAPDQAPYLAGGQDFPRLSMPHKPAQPCERVSYGQEVCRGIARPGIH
jgi:hypothetical protein